MTVFSGGDVRSAFEGRACVHGIVLAVALGSQGASAQAQARPQAEQAAPLQARELPPARKVAKPLWELGLGAAGLSLPAYRGSAERSNYLLPVPYVVYRGELLRADRDGARAVLFDSDRIEVDLSLAGSVPVQGESEGRRAGMERLPGTVEVGPNLNLTLWRSARRAAKLDLRLPLRAAITLESSPRMIGGVFAPNLNLDLSDWAAGWNAGFLVGPLFQSSKYNDHYYGVSPAEATASRPAYRAGGGYAGWQAVAATSRRFKDFWLGAFVRYDSLRGAVFADSPLIERSSGVGVGVALAWVLATSQQMVMVDE